MKMLLCVIGVVLLLVLLPALVIPYSVLVLIAGLAGYILWRIVK